MIVRKMMYKEVDEITDYIALPIYVAHIALFSNHQGNKDEGK